MISKSRKRARKENEIHGKKTAVLLPSGLFTLCSCKDELLQLSLHRRGVLIGVVGSLHPLKKLSIKNKSKFLHLTQQINKREADRSRSCVVTFGKIASLHL